MSCQPFADALLDFGLKRPEGLEAHLAGCAACRALAEGHAVATRLVGTELPSRPALRAAAVLPRLSAVAAALLLAAGAWLALGRGTPDAPVAAVPSPDPSEESPAAAKDPREGAVLVAEAGTDEWAALATLHQQVSAYYARTDAEALVPYRGMPDWFALQRLEERIDALTFSSPQSPRQESP